MKVGDKILLKKNIDLEKLQGIVISSIPGQGTRNYVMKIDCKHSLFFILKDSEFIRKGEKVFIPQKTFSKEEGSCGTVVHVLPYARYLCEFKDPFCNIELNEDEIVKFNPKTGVFALLNKVRLKKDIPEHALKKGMEGVIILVYFEPSLNYEVEFYLGEKVSPSFESYVFLPDQLEFIEESPYTEII